VSSFFSCFLLVFEYAKHDLILTCFGMVFSCLFPVPYLSH
jgi:hypothetical protein